MPATKVSHELQQQLFDQTRQAMLKISKTKQGCDATINNADDPFREDVRHLTLPERLQYFRASVKFHIGDLDSSLQMSVCVADSKILFRHHIASNGADLCCLNQNGSQTKWITHCNGENDQLQEYLSADVGDETYAQIGTFLDIIEHVDFVKIFKASTVAVGNDFEHSDDPTWKIGTLKDGEVYQFQLDSGTGQPTVITQHLVGDSEFDEPLSDENINNSSGMTEMMISNYYKDSKVEEVMVVPNGIKSDVQLIVDSSMTVFEDDWSPEAREYICEIFNEIDEDGDGFVSTADVQQRLEEAGQSSEISKRLTSQMCRLICDSNDPSEEIDFHNFCGFWIMMLVDGDRVPDAMSQLELVKMFRQLFFGIPFY